jgi:hypothetical protein
MFDIKNANIRLTLLSIFIFLAAFLINDPFGFFESDYSSASPVIDEKIISNIQQIEILNQNQPPIGLISKDNQWYIKSGNTEYQADNNKVNKALENLLDIRKYYEVTNSPEKYAEFEVGENDFQINIKGQSHEYTLVLGKQGASFNTTLVRLKNEKKVFSVKGNLRGDWNQNIDYFRNKKLLRMAKENVSQVDIKGPVNYSIVNLDNTWTINSSTGTIGTNQPRVDRLIDDLGNIEGLNFHQGINPGSLYGNVTVHLKSNIAFKIEVRKAGSEYLVKSDYNPYWQYISEYRIKTIFPAYDEIKSVSRNQE